MNSSRSDIQSKKRKQNIFLNTSIAVVFLLIAGVSAFIFLGDNENQAAETEEKTIAEQVQENAGAQDDNSNDTNELTASEIDSDDSEGNSDEDAESEEAAADDEKKKKEAAERKKKEDKKKENEKKEESDTNEDSERPSDGEFKPVGTEQTGEHVSSYEEGSVDWNEKLKAAAYATGLDMSTMTVWWVGNDGGPQKARVDVASPGAGAAEYRVHMEWVDQKGWKPVKVVEL
ncbi:YrrS family protein [Jeotgalibacillus malaysiensis]|uniref:YrrS family protein n=1 Tax=Jeotgalibacillus malaysiensis TaxID=1508404 RepID=UPI00384C35C0